MSELKNFIESVTGEYQHLINAEIDALKRYLNDTCYTNSQRLDKIVETGKQLTTLKEKLDTIYGLLEQSYNKTLGHLK